MKSWKIYSIIITIILVVLIIGFGVYALFFNEKFSEQDAKKIALQYANLNESDVTIMSINKDTEDREYEISFYDNTYEYDVDVNYNNGKVKKFEKDIRDNISTNTNINAEQNTNSDNNINTNTNVNSNTNTSANSDSNMNNNNTSIKEKYISKEKAKEIALNHAGIKSDKVTFGKVELDVDHNMAKYEIEFYYNNIEYEYELNAVTGEILKYEKGR